MEFPLVKDKEKKKKRKMALNRLRQANLVCLKMEKKSISKQKQEDLNSVPCVRCLLN